jgi:hypothetical protein
MTTNELTQLDEILAMPPFKRLPALYEWRKTITVTEEVKGVRTDTQSDSLFLWFCMIEKEAENAGVTWDMILRHVHQLRVTKENLHEACKQLIDGLWHIKSTKQIKKQGQIEIIVDHFVDLFSKEGLTLPPFPSRENPLLGMKLEQHNNLKNENYTEMNEELSANKF